VVLAELLSAPLLEKRRRPGGYDGWTLARDAAIVAVLAFAAIAVASHFRSTTYNNYTRLAYAMLHGHLWIDWPGRIIDAAEYHGRHYGVDGPFPAIFVLPLALFFGENANQTIPSIVLGTVDVSLCWVLLRKLGVARVPSIWLTLFFFAGTDLFWCAMLGDVWFFAHVCAVGFTLLILIELCTRRRGWLVALLAFCAFESRFTLALAVPFYAYQIATGELAREAGRDVAAFDVRGALRNFGLVLAGGAVCWVAYNEAMWGTVVDIGHTLYYHQDSWGHATGSPFSLAYFPYQFYSFFLQAPVLVEWLQVAQPPYFKVDPHGVALTFTSPALVLAFFAKGSRRLVASLWIVAAMVAVPSFLYYLNGWYQFGMRHALDFEPFLLVLMALGVRERMPRWGAALCAYSALVGIWGVWYWDAYFRTGD
jgi:hypothetical protein